MQPTTYRSSNSGANRSAADLILTGGRIYTGDAGRPFAEAVAIRNGRFIAVGSDAEARALGDTDTPIRDLKGAFAMPGLHDMHTHPDLALGPRYAGYLDVGIGEPTPEEVRDAILGYAADHPEAPWVFGQHFVHFSFRRAGITPDRHWLDSFIPDRPVAIMDRMWGSVLVNSKGLEAARITAATPDPGNGYIVRDDLTREPTGILVDGAYALVIGAMPPIPHAALVRAYRDGLRHQASRGVVAAKYVHVCEHRLNALKALDDGGELMVRVEAAISWQDDIFPVKRRWALLAGERHFYRSDRLNANAVKFHFDGTAEPSTSFLLSDWPGQSGWRGKLNLTPEHLFDMVADMDRQGIRVIAHCTGDGASDVFLDAVAACRERAGGQRVRHQCAHSTLLHPDNVARFAALDVVAEFSPVGWYYSPFTTGARSQYGMDRLKGAYNVRGVLDAGGVAVMGTDWPVSQLNPWVGFETLITRANPWFENDDILGEGVSLDEAIRMLTLNGAWSMGIEAEAGSIEVGKRADLAVLDRDLTALDPRGNLHDTRSLLTLVDGQASHDPLGWLAETPHAAPWADPAPEF